MKTFASQSYTYTHTSYTELTRVFLDHCNSTVGRKAELDEDDAIRLYVGNQSYRFENIDEASSFLVDKGIFFDREPYSKTNPRLGGQIRWDIIEEVLG